MKCSSETLNEKQGNIDFKSSKNRFESVEIDGTSNVQLDSNYFSMSSKRNKVSIQVDVRLENNKILNKRINE